MAFPLQTGVANPAEGHIAAIFNHISMDSAAENRYHAKKIAIIRVDPCSLDRLTGSANKQEYSSMYLWNIELIST